MSRFRARAVLALAALVGAGLFAAWYLDWLPQGGRSGPSGVGPRAMGPDAAYSNVLPNDYLGPEACGKCHQQQHKLWSGHPHRFMNQLPAPASIKGDFADHVWTVRPGYTVTFSTSGPDYLMTVDRPAGKRTVYKVTRTVGSRFVQFYIGVQLEGVAPAGDQVYTVEHKLPFGYWMRMKRWLPGDYFDVTGGDGHEGLADGLPVVVGVDAPPRFASYGDSCVHCHNTYPHAYRLFRESLSGFPDAVIEPDFRPFSAALSPWVKVRPNEAAFEDLPYKVNPDKDLVTVGISCESCHMGGREHGKLQKDISFFPTHPHVSVRARSEEKAFRGKRDDPATSVGICAQCHAARAVSTQANGAHVRNSAESTDLAAGFCTTKIRCVDCHEPHTPGVPSGGPAVPRHVAACVECHPKYASREQAAAHTRHPATSGVTCLDCHMPRISQGLDEVSRTHRISPPVEASMIAAGAPNACNLCHLDKTPRWAVDEVKRGWGRVVGTFDSTPASLLDRPAAEVWGESGESITRIVAMDAASRSPKWRAHLPGLRQALDDGNPPNRAFAQFAAERIAGRRLTVEEYDIRAGPAQRRRQIALLPALLEKKR